MELASLDSRAERWSALNALPDEQLAVCLLGGESDALTVLFDRYHKLVFSVAMRIVNDAGEAEEVVQTVFIDFFRALANFDPQKGILKVWLLQYAYHRALNRRRHLAANRMYKWVDLENAAQEPQLASNPAEVAEVSRLMEQLLQTVTPRRREILELTYFEGFTADEIAIKLDLSVNVVRHELYRSLAALREVMASSGSGATEPVLDGFKGVIKSNA